MNCKSVRSVNALQRRNLWMRQEMNLMELLSL